MVSSSDLPTQQLDFLANWVLPILDKCHTPFLARNPIQGAIHRLTGAQKVVLNQRNVSR